MYTVMNSSRSLSSRCLAGTWRPRAITDLPREGRFVQLGARSLSRSLTARTRTRSLLPLRSWTAYPGEEWKCIFAQYALPFVESSVFIAEGVYDSWQLNNILQLGCAGYGKAVNATTCSPAQLQAFQAYGATMRATVQGVLQVRLPTVLVSLPRRA
jgi:hypothetical protein